VFGDRPPLAFSAVTVKSDRAAFGAMALGPIAVLPELQRRGIGSLLVRAGIEECRRLGHGIVVRVGHPEFYPRVFLVPARACGSECEFEVPDGVCYCSKPDRYRPLRARVQGGSLARQPHLRHWPSSVRCACARGPWPGTGSSPPGKSWWPHHRPPGTRRCRRSR
jgi:hypothetical protein